jgi:hypothetical protein
MQEAPSLFEKGQAVVPKDRLFIARGQLTVDADRRGVLHLVTVRYRG